MLDNFASYIQNGISLGLTIIDQLRELHEPTGRPTYSTLYLRYNSRQDYTVLKEVFPLSFLPLLRKLNKGVVDLLKARKLLNEGSNNPDVALLLDEMYIYKKKLVIKMGKLLVKIKTIPY